MPESDRRVVKRALPVREKISSLLLTLFSPALTKGAAFVHNGWMPPIDPSLVPKDPLLPPLPEDREEFPSDASEWRSVDEVNDEMAASFRAAARRQRAAAAAPDGSTEMQQLSSPLLSAAEVP